MRRSDRAVGLAGVRFWQVEDQFSVAQLRVGFKANSQIERSDWPAGVPHGLSEVSPYET